MRTPRLLAAAGAALVTFLLVFFLSRPLGALPALGPLLDPQWGWAANAGDAGEVPGKITLPGLQQEVEIWLEAREVPHIRAQNDHDLYLALGYVHARYRLFQMDLQTRAAGGFVSEILGRKALSFDKAQRRKGMVYGAENSLRALEKDPATKAMLQAYTDGVNAYIQTLSPAALPLEYKLIGFAPAAWTPLRTALLMKYMADDLTGYTEDLQQSALRTELGDEKLNFLFPPKLSGSVPVIPAGTPWGPAFLQQPLPPLPADELFPAWHPPQPPPNRAPGRKAEYFNQLREERSGIGSNNWAIAGSHTESGAPILCNDPHLGLNLPSLWFEVQLTAPGINVYGVSLPGAPGVIIGFNDSLSWGMTNNYRDVKDYFLIKPADADHYWFNNEKRAYTKRLEHIALKGEGEVTDTVLYTVHGPVQYDKNNPAPDSSRQLLAMQWMAHQGTNELKAVYLVNKARNYNEFVNGISYFSCPAQNFAYADRAGNIAMWAQGLFINKWKDQGRFIMRGDDSSTLWGRQIPAMENPHVLNPQQGYVASANQAVTDDTYPYWYNGYFTETRSWEINRFIRQMLEENKAITVADMQALQNNNWSLPASQLWPLLHEVIKNDLPKDAENWDFYMQAGSHVAALFQVWSYYLHLAMWKDNFLPANLHFYPSQERTLQLIMDNEAPGYFDNPATPQKETLQDLMASSYQQARDSLAKVNRESIPEWYRVKNTSLLHLTKIPAFSVTGIANGGWGTTINAMKSNHGPSWRMVVQMGKDSIEAYGIYPGGQSGDPGSAHYTDNVDLWAKGKYRKLLFLHAKADRPQGMRTMVLAPAP